MGLCHCGTICPATYAARTVSLGTNVHAQLLVLVLIVVSRFVIIVLSTQILVTMRKVGVKNVIMHTGVDTKLIQAHVGLQRDTARLIARMILEKN